MQPTYSIIEVEIESGIKRKYINYTPRIWQGAAERWKYLEGLGKKFAFKWFITTDSYTEYPVM